MSNRIFFISKILVNFIYSPKKTTKIMTTTTIIIIAAAVLVLVMLCTTLMYACGKFAPTLFPSISRISRDSDYVYAPWSQFQRLINRSPKWLRVIYTITLWRLWGVIPCTILFYIIYFTRVIWNII